jgi:aryl-alcohol dehydrogenase-like predicted oxidoreductase
MLSRRFGRMGWPVSEVGYGMWGLAGWTGSDDEQTRLALERAVELGCTFFDTAWGYGAGHSERMLGELVRKHPEKKLYVATKIPPRNMIWPSRREFTLDDCFPPDHIHEYAHKSLENLGLATIDCLQFHVWEDAWASDTRWQHAMEDLRTKGIIQSIGISVNRWEPWNGIAAIRTGMIDAVQVIYNIFDQSPKDELWAACREQDVAVIARVPFDEGTLTGTLTKETTWPEGDWRSTYFVPENLAASVDRAEALRPMIPHGMTMAEMALRWILADPMVSTVIPGMRKIAHVEANLGVSDGRPLAPELMERLDANRWDRKPTAWSQ